MPDQLQQRIAAIVDNHWPNGGGGFCEGCWWRDSAQGPGEGSSGWANHVAEALVSELGLTPKQGIQQASE